jgi:uncharacterized protein
MINLLPRDTKFYDLFEKLTGHAVAAAKHLAKLAADFPNIDGAIQSIRVTEHDADEVSHEALDRLDRAFITPFDREDIHTLVGGLDDIVDEVDALAKRFKLYHVGSMDPDFAKQAQVLMKATAALLEAVTRLRKHRNLGELTEVLIQVHQLENDGDEINHNAVSRLYEGHIPPLEVMKWKELFDRVEKAIDKCEDVANTLARIALKHG